MQSTRIETKSRGTDYRQSSTLKRVLLLIATLLGLVVLASAAKAMPRNTHQVPEGYWLGGTPTATDIGSLDDHGIRVIVSAVRLDEDVREAVRRHHIQHVNVRFGRTFPDAETLLGGVADYAPEEIYIHCTHGGDRTGAILAFLLVLNHDWRPDHALLAVALASERDLAGLVPLLEEVGLVVTEDELATLAGIYSGAANGGFGGLKVRGPDYRILVRTVLERLAERGVVIADPVEPQAPEIPLIDAPAVVSQ